MTDAVRLVPPPPDALLRACRRLLRPLVRLAMRAGVTFPVLSDMVRTLCVEVASRELLTSPRARTDSRISLLTGVHRKEIRRLRELPGDADPIPPAITLGTQVVGRWLGLGAYTAFNGQPLPLPRTAGAEGEPSFDSLVESITTDIRPRAVLDDWLSQGLVTLDGEDRVHLNTAAFLPRGGGREQMFYFARNLHDHIAAASDNVSAPGPAPFLDRALHYDQLDETTARRLESIARDAAQAVLVEVNRAAIELVEAMPPAAPGTAQSRVNFGLFVYRDSDAEPEALPE